MATSLQEIQKKLKELEEKNNRSGSNNNSGGGDRAVYPFWNIAEGSEAVLRFLPDEDPNNVFFWVERQMIRLKFPGVKGGEENKPVTVTVPCMEMYDGNEPCPILTKVRPWFKEPGMDEIARSYWKKRSYIFQGLVVEDPMNEERTAEDNPIRRFIIGPQIFNLIKDVLMDEDMENIPTDFVNGTDFRLSKTSKGQYADYSTSKWARKERALTEVELGAIEKHGLQNLSDFLPKRPTAEGIQAISEMFEASQNDELYDPARWGEFYRPYGVDVPSNTTESAATSATPAATSAQTAEQTVPVSEAVDATPTEPVAESAPAPEAPAPEAPATDSAATGKKSADEILAMIQSRKSA